MTEIMIANTANLPMYTNKELAHATAKIFKIGEKVRRYAYETAFIMAQVDESKCYVDDGFKNVHDWAMKTFGFKKSTSYSMLKVGKEYTRVLTDKNGKASGYASNLLPEDSESDFSASQIIKMLPAGHDIAVELVEDGEITVDMSCREIEKIVQSKMATEEEPEEAENTEEEPEEAEAENTEEASETEDTRRVYDDEGNIYEVPVNVWSEIVKYKVIEG